MHNSQLKTLRRHELLNSQPVKTSIYCQMDIILLIQPFNPLTAKLFNCNFHPFEVVSRCRDPQLQVSEI